MTIENAETSSKRSRRKIENPQPNQSLIRALEERDWSQQELADALGTDARNVGRWIRGEYQPQTVHREKLKEVLNKTEEELGLSRKEVFEKQPDEPEYPPQNEADLEHPLQSSVAQQSRISEEPAEASSAQIVQEFGFLQRKSVHSSPKLLLRVSLVLPVFLFLVASAAVFYEVHTTKQACGWLKVAEQAKQFETVILWEHPCNEEVHAELIAKVEGQFKLTLYGENKQIFLISLSRHLLAGQYVNTPNYNGYGPYMTSSSYAAIKGSALSQLALSSGSP